HYSTDRAAQLHGLAMVSEDVTVGMSGAARVVGCCRQTLYNRRDGRFPRSPGRPPLLPVLDEIILHEWTEHRANSNMPVSLHVFREAVKEIAVARGRPFRTEDGRPSQAWMKGFLLRRGRLIVRRARCMPSKLPLKSEFVTLFMCLLVAPPPAPPAFPPSPLSILLTKLEPHHLTMNRTIRLISSFLPTPLVSGDGV